MSLRDFLLALIGVRPKPPKPEPAPEPPPPTNMQLNVRVEDATTAKLLVGTVTLNGVPHGINGTATYAISRALYGQGLNVNVYVDGYTTQFLAVSEYKDPNTLPTFKLAALPKPVETIGTADGRLEMRGLYIYEHGAKKRLVGIDAFSILLWWLKGERAKVAAYVDWMIREKIDYARAFGMFNRGTGQGVGVLIPAEWPNYNAAVLELFLYFRRRKVRIWFDCFADMNLSDVRPTNPLMDVNQPAFYTMMGQIIRDNDCWNIILGGGNQWQGNGWNPGVLVPTAGVICARGSGNEETLPWLPPFDLSQFDPGRSEYYRKSKAFRELRDGDTTEGLKVPGPIGGNEPIGVYRSNDGSTACDARLLWDLYAGMAAFGAAFACVHWRGGISDLEVPTDNLALNAVRACIRGFLEAPDSYAEAAYTRGDGNGGNTTLALYHDDTIASRTYELRAGPTSLAFALGVTPAWDAEFQDGAWPTASYGYDTHRPTMFVCAR